MTLEDPISQIAAPEEADQEKLESEVRELLYSDFMEDKLKGVEMTPRVTNPEVRSAFDKEAHNILDTLISTANKDSVISIVYAIDAIRHIPYLEGQYSKLILRRASETYNKLDSARRKDPKNENLKRFFLEVDKN